MDIFHLIHGRSCERICHLSVGSLLITVVLSLQFVRSSFSECTFWRACFLTVKPYARFTWLPPRKTTRSPCNPSPSAFMLSCNISSWISERKNYPGVCATRISEVKFFKSSVVVAEPAHTSCEHHSVTNLVKWVGSAITEGSVLGKAVGSDISLGHVQLWPCSSPFQWHSVNFAQWTTVIRAPFTRVASQVAIICCTRSI